MRFLLLFSCVSCFTFIKDRGENLEGEFIKGEKT